MDKRLLLTQTCTHCFEVLSYIFENKLAEKMLRSGIRIEMVNRDNQKAVDMMKKAIDWLVAHVDKEKFEDQESATPIIVFEEDGNVEQVVVGSDDIIVYLGTL